MPVCVGNQRLKRELLAQAEAMLNEASLLCSPTCRQRAEKFQLTAAGLVVTRLHDPTLPTPDVAGV
jgi:hypothetical protein